MRKGGYAPPPLGHFAGPFLPDRDGIASTWVHDSCVMWCPEVYFDQRKQRLKNVTSALKRGSYIKCNHCGLKGATVGCTLPQCPKSYHLACAHAAGSTAYLLGGASVDGEACELRIVAPDAAVHIESQSWFEQRMKTAMSGGAGGGEAPSLRERRPQPYR